MQKDGIKVFGYTGTWHVIDEAEYAGGKKLYLLEHNTYGEETAGVIIDDAGNIVMDGVWNGFRDYEEFMADEPESEEIWD